MIKKCLICGKSFQVPSAKKRAKYCSNPCRWESQKGKGFSEERRKNISKALTGRKLSAECKQKISNFFKNRLVREKNPMWRGGVRKSYDGYIFIHNRKHPSCDCNGYVKQSRLVMEKKLGRYLTRKEVVHHRNEIKDDDRIENLKLFKSKSGHISHHNKLRKH